MPKGGVRPGSGRPSAFSLEQKRLASLAVVSAEEKAKERALKKAQKHIFKAAEDGERWAVQWLAEHELGKAASKLPDKTDTDINVNERFDRKPFTCEKCGHKNPELKAPEYCIDSVLYTMEELAAIIRQVTGGALKAEEAYVTDPSSDI